MLPFYYVWSTAGIAFKCIDLMPIATCCKNLKPKHLFTLLHYLHHLYPLSSEAVWGLIWRWGLISNQFFTFWQQKKWVPARTKQFQSGTKQRTAYTIILVDQRFYCTLSNVYGIDILRVRPTLLSLLTLTGYNLRARQSGPCAFSTMLWTLLPFH